MIYEVKNIKIGSLLKVFPIIISIIGAIIGIFAMFIFPTAATAELGFGARILAYIIFVILYALIMLASALVFALLYNWATKLVGGLLISLEEKRTG